MNALLDPIDFKPRMSEFTTLTIRIDAQLKKRLDAFAEQVHIDLNDLVGQMIRDALFRNSPEFADPTHPQTIEYLALEAGVLQAIRGEVVSEEAFSKFIHDKFGAEDPGSPRKS